MGAYKRRWIAPVRHHHHRRQTNQHRAHQRRRRTTFNRRQHQSNPTQSSSTMASPVTVEPAALQVPAAGGQVALQLQNTNAEVRYAVKVKSTNNDHYRVNPVYGVVEAGAALALEITRLEGPPKNDDRLELLFLPVDAECADPKAPFAAGQAPEFKLEVAMAAE